MPIYEYRCENCEHTLEKIQKLIDDPLIDCPECKEPKLKRLMSAGSFDLKGDGFHKPGFDGKKT